MSRLALRKATPEEIAAARALLAESTTSPEIRAKYRARVQRETPQRFDAVRSAAAVRVELERLRDENTARRIETPPPAPSRPKLLPIGEPTREEYLGAIEWTGIKDEVAEVRQLVEERKRGVRT